MLVCLFVNLYIFFYDHYKIQIYFLSIYSTFNKLILTLPLFTIKLTFTLIENFKFYKNLTRWLVDIVTATIKSKVKIITSI